MNGFSNKSWSRWVAAAGLCIALIERSVAQVEGSLKNLDSDTLETKIVLDATLIENKALREKLVVAEDSIAALQRHLAAATGEAEVFRRKAGELNVRLEALGAGTLDERLVRLLSQLKLAESERGRLKEGLVGLAEAVVRFQKTAESCDAGARLDLEAGMRGASKALGVASVTTPEANATPASLAEGMVIGIQEDLALIVANVGSLQGAKIGMPLEVFRNEERIGMIRIVDVRERISGALIQNLSDKAKIKLNDRLRVAAQQNQF